MALSKSFPKQSFRGQRVMEMLSRVINDPVDPGLLTLSMAICRFLRGP